MIPTLDAKLEAILEAYSKSFRSKVFGGESTEVDELMQVFGLTQEKKMGNRQFWGRELGMCFQRIVVEICKERCRHFSPARRRGADELFDLQVGKDAIDTKYRIGSGDSGTLKKLRQYGKD